MAYEKEISEFKTKENFTTNDLLLLIKILRCENGCPWDREQTHKSITHDFIEEVYEAIEAIETENSDALCEELGDVLLQVVFHTTLSEEAGEFTYADTVNGVCKKMVERHPHVFGSIEVETTDEVLKNWDKIKAESKAQQTLYDRLSAVPVTFPSLMRTQKLIHRASKFGETSDCGEYDFTSAQEPEKEIAQALWKIVSAADKVGIDAETALRHLCEEFTENHK